MEIKVVENYAQMSRAAADIFSEALKNNPKSVLGLATGDTPIGLYDCLVEDYKAGKIDFAEATSVNLDEYYPITPDNDQSYRYFMNKYLFDRVNINKENTYVPDGMTKDPDVLVAATHLTALTPSTIEANSRFFASEDDVPKKAITMGMQPIFKARKIVVIANGKGKADAIKAMLSGQITAKCPASLLCLHPNVTLICDKEAYGE